MNFEVWWDALETREKHKLDRTLVAEAWAAATAAERERLASWIALQRNDIPAAGAEFSNAIRMLSNDHA